MTVRHRLQCEENAAPQAANVSAQLLEAERAPQAALAAEAAMAEYLPQAQRAPQAALENLMQSERAPQAALKNLCKCHLPNDSGAPFTEGDVHPMGSGRLWFVLVAFALPMVINYYQPIRTPFNGNTPATFYCEHIDEKMLSP